MMTANLAMYEELEKQINDEFLKAATVGRGCFGSLLYNADDDTCKACELFEGCDEAHAANRLEMLDQAEKEVMAEAAPQEAAAELTALNDFKAKQVADEELRIQAEANKRAELEARVKTESDKRIAGIHAAIAGMTEGPVPALVEITVAEDVAEAIRAKADAVTLVKAPAAVDIPMNSPVLAPEATHGAEQAQGQAFSSVDLGALKLKSRKYTVDWAVIVSALIALKPTEYKRANEILAAKCPEVDPATQYGYTNKILAGLATQGAVKWEPKARTIEWLA